MYELNDKINSTPEFLENLSSEGWERIEELQAKIANMAASSENTNVIQLLNNLLTSYYVFVGSLENIKDGNPIADQAIQQKHLEIEKEVALLEPTEPEQNFIKPQDFEMDEYKVQEAPEPFEYFVDFDEPFGDPLTDEDLYGN